MGSRGVWASVGCLLEDSKGELDKSLLVRRHSPMLYKDNLRLEDNEFAQGHAESDRARTKIQDSELQKFTSLQHLKKKKSFLSFLKYPKEKQGRAFCKIGRAHV